MVVAYTWNVTQMNAYPQVGEETDVVFNVHWTLIGEDAGIFGSAYGSQGVTVNPEEPFTPYADLTQAQVVGWVKDAMGAERVSSCEAGVAQQISDQIAPPVVTPPLPWG